MACLTSQAGQWSSEHASGLTTPTTLSTSSVETIETSSQRTGPDEASSKSRPILISTPESKSAQILSILLTKCLAKNVACRKLV